MRAPEPSGARTRAAATFAAGEPSGAPLRDLEHLAARARLELQALGDRQSEALDRRAAVGQHRLLREGGERLGDL